MCYALNFVFLLQTRQRPPFKEYLSRILGVHSWEKHFNEYHGPNYFILIRIFRYLHTNPGIIIIHLIVKENQAEIK